jgi:hypothetical protein
MTNSMGFLGLGWVALTALSSGFVVLVGWRARQRAARLAAPSGPVSANPTPPLPWHGDVGLVTFESRKLEVDHEISGALAQLRDVALRDQVEVQVVVQPSLAVWADPCALRQMLLGIVSQAIERAEGSALLVSASWHGGRTQVIVMDDGPAGDPAILMGRLREVEQCAALQGGTLEFECRPLRGNKVVLRMPGAVAPDAHSTDDDVPEEMTADGAPSTGMLSAS